jgi:hypothetical protein
MLPDVQVQQDLIFSLTRMNLDSYDTQWLERKETLREAGEKGRHPLTPFVHLLPHIPFHPVPLV